MKRGFLLEAARTHRKAKLGAAAVIVVLAVFVLLLNSTYVFNWIAGPFPLTPQLADWQSHKEFVRASGKFFFTGIVQQTKTSVGFMRGLVGVGMTDVSATYYALPLEDHLLIVKAPPDFSGYVAEGRLVELPGTVKAALTTKSENEDVKKGDFYPLMLDASISYRADANLFVILAAPLLLLGLLTMVTTGLQSNPAKHRMMRYIARRGAVLSMLPKVEQEFLSAGEAARVGPLYVTSTWVFDTNPNKPLVFHLGDIVGAMKKVTAERNKPLSFSVELWLREDPLTRTIKGSSSECDAILQALGARAPWIILEPGSAIESRWRSDRKGCIAEMEARKRQHEAASANSKPADPGRAPGAYAGSTKI